jgi:hypothetical protein
LHHGQSGVVYILTIIIIPLFQHEQQLLHPPQVGQSSATIAPHFGHFNSFAI